MLFKEGDRTNFHFYIAASGSYDTFMKCPGGEGEASQPVQSYDVVPGAPNPSFGELGLLYDIPRNATMVCRKKGVVWELSQANEV